MVWSVERMNGAFQKITDNELELFNGVISKHLGIYFTESKKEIFESRVRPRLESLHLKRFIDYYYYLQLNVNDEINRLAAFITNNESYFFREMYHFDAIFNYALQELKASAVLPNILRFLSAGCACGEEPYTLNIMAKENQFRMWDYKIDIDAFDIDKKCLESAGKAEYTANAMRFLREEEIIKYFRKTENGKFELKDIFRNPVKFYYGNVLQLETYQKVMPYDVILCRNVLIYFSEPAIHQAINNFAQCLRPGGFLLLGHSESIIGMSPFFECVRLGNHIGYKRVVQ
jgi:chemotaxis protein methyltransferase CheR